MLADIRTGLEGVEKLESGIGRSFASIAGEYRCFCSTAPLHVVAYYATLSSRWERHVRWSATGEGAHGHQ